MSYRNLLARATEGTDAPTPGYIYVDLAKAATGNPTACQDMAVYLTRRLASKTNPNIKYKCCRVLAKLCDEVPRNGFRRCVAQDHAGVTAIKEAMNFRGAPDPVRGDEPNQKVRAAAKECLDAVYRESVSAEPSGTLTGGGGYGGAGGGIASGNQYGAPPHYSGGAAGGGGGGSRMQGFGNPHYQETARYNEPVGFSGVVKEAGEVIAGMIKDPLARNIPDHPRQGNSGNLPGYSGPTYGRPPPGSAELSRRTEGQWTMASNRGPGAIQPDYQRDPPPQQQHHHQPYAGGVTAHSGTVGGSWGSSAAGAVRGPTGANHSTPSVTINSVPGASSGSGGGTAVSDGTYEKNLVLELCPPGGMKPVPPPDKLASFARACSSLNSDLVCPVLLDCLEDGQPWIIRAKALCAMETAIANGTKLDGTNPYRDFFFACQDEVAPLASHARPAISEPARRVLALLGVAPGPMPSVPAAPPVVAAPNLLDFDDEPQPSKPLPPPPSHAPPPPPPPDAAANSMFGGMQVKNSPAPPQQPPVQAAAPVAAAPNLLDFDAVAPAPASNHSFRPNSGDTAAVQTVVAATSSMFDQLSVKDSEDKKESDNITAVATNGSSAFGFINETTAPGEPHQAPQQSFDPLKNATISGSHNLTPSSAQRKTMQMSPEQMQAMAYQQMMMMQHQQMQQMQMAMAMQHQIGGGGIVMPGGIPMYPPLGGAGGVAPIMPGTGGVPRRTASLGGSAAGGGGGGGGAQPSLQQFSFAPKPAQKDDKKFDFVKDAMQTAGHKK